MADSALWLVRSHIHQALCKGSIVAQTSAPTSTQSPPSILTVEHSGICLGNHLDWTVIVIYLYLQLSTSHFLLNVYVAKTYLDFIYLFIFQEEDLYLNELSQTIYGSWALRAEACHQIQRILNKLYSQKWSWLQCLYCHFAQFNASLVNKSNNLFQKQIYNLIDPKCLKCVCS